MTNYLDKLIDAEARMLSEQRALLDRELRLLDSLVELYELLGRLVDQSKAELTTELTASLSFVLACRHRLNTAALAILRGSQADAFIHTRLAIENAAFARRVLKHPHLAELWLNAGDSAADYARYRSKFPPGKLFPKGHGILQELYNRYDYCSTQSHPSLASFTGRLRPSSSGREQTLSLRHFDVVDQPPEQLRGMAVWLVETHFGILRLFEEVFGSLSSFPGKDWRKQLGLFEHELRAIKDELRPYFENQASQTGLEDETG